MKLLKEHIGQYLAHILPDDLDPDLDAVATISQDETKLTVSLVNRHLYESREIMLNLPEESWKITKSDIVTAEEVRNVNTFDEPFRICEAPFGIEDTLNFVIPKHSVVRICLQKV